MVQTAATPTITATTVSGTKLTPHAQHKQRFREKASLQERHMASTQSLTPPPLHHHACDEAPLLVVLLAKAGHVRLNYVEQLGHNLCAGGGGQQVESVARPSGAIRMNVPSPHLATKMQEWHKLTNCMFRLPAHKAAGVLPADNKANSQWPRL